MKIAPIMRAAEKQGSIEQVLVHTGQHYDDNMSKCFFDELGIREPDVNLEVGSGPHGKQTGEIMKRFEEFLMAEGGDIVVVVGDVNSTIACGLVASKLHIPLAHVEAGLRSYDRRMPEEINRLLTDTISDFLFTPAEEADENLRKEGIPEEKIFLVGDVMIDTLIWEMNKIDNLDEPPLNELKNKEYATLTLHRPGNVDNKKILSDIMSALSQIAEEITLVFPAHPRTMKRIKEFKVQVQNQKLKIIEPLSYRDFLRLYINSQFVLTDSGSIQQETTFLDIPCITIRENTERPFTITKGTNVLVGRDPQKIIKEAKKILNGSVKKAGDIPLWDGKASTRIINILSEAKNI